MMETTHEKTVRFDLLFGTITAHITDMITVTDDEGVILYQSPSVNKTLGFSADERIGQHIRNFTETDSHAFFDNNFNTVLAQPGAAVAMQRKVFARNGDLLLVKSTFTNNLHIPGVNAIIINDTLINDTADEASQQYEALQAEYNRLVLAAGAAEVGIWEWDLLTNKLVWDNTMYRLYGMAKGTTAENYAIFEQYLHPDDRQKVARELQIALGGERNFNTEFRLIWPDGSVHYTRAIGFVQRDSQGTAIKMGGTNWDITREKADAQRLQNANRQLITLFNSVDEMLVSADMLTMQIIQISPACEAIYGYTPEEFYADNLLWFNSVHPDDRGFIQQNKEKFERNEVCAAQYRIITKDNELRWIEEKISPTLDENGVLIRIDGVMRDITERKKTEAELCKSQQDYQALVNTIDGIVWEADAKTFEFLFVSKPAETLLGYPVADWLRNPTFWQDHIHPDDRDKAVNYCLKQTLEMKSHQFEYRMFAADGRIVWLQDVVSVIVENNEPVYLRGVMTDITNRKKSEKEIRDTETRYRQIVETAQEGIWTIDEHNVTNFVNEAICNMLGYSAAEMLGKPLTDFLRDEEKVLLNERMEKRRGGAMENRDVSYITKNGELLLANISANAIHDEHGVYRGSLAMVTDIRDRRHYEETLKRSEANLRTIFNNTDSSYVLISTDLKIVSFNELAQQYSEMENGKPLRNEGSIMDYFPLPYQYYIREILNKARNGEKVNYELSRKQADGSEKWYDVRWVSVTNRDHKHVGYILSNKDITANKLAALEREKIIADLVQRNKDQEQFTYIISHNLRAPVANIMGLAGLMEADDTSAEEKKLIMQGIAKSVQGLDYVIMDINHVLQVKEKLNERKEIVDFYQLVTEIKASISSTISSENVVLNCDFEQAGQLFTIRSYLYSIFYNLILNSIKYRQNDLSPVIEITAQLLESKIEIVFRDNGKGINMAKNSSQLFGLYRRFDTTMEGKGMGLYMVKTQVEALGGIINVKSEVDKGTEFAVQLPIA